MLLVTVRTDVAYWDTGDLQTVAWLPGIAYPTGFPGFVLVGWLWSHVLPFGTVAARVNALSALAMALGAGTVTALALLFEAAAPLALLAGWLFAFAHTVWFRATYADAHPLGFAVAFAAVAHALHWAVRGERRALGGAIVLAGLALAIDNSTVLILTGVVIAAFARRPPLRTLAVSCVAAFAIVTAVYAYLPLRSAYVVAHGLDPTLALGVPPGRPYWNDHDPRTTRGFHTLVTGSDFGAGGTLRSLLAPASIVAAYQRFQPDLANDFPLGIAAAGLVGLGFVAWRWRWCAAALAVGAVVPALFGGSYAAEADPERYILTLFALLAIGAAVAADRTARAFVRAGSGENAPLVVGALLVAAVVLDLHGGGDLARDRNDGAPRALAERVLLATRPDAVIVTEWVYAAPLAYVAYVEHRYDARVVVCEAPSVERDNILRWARVRQVVVVDTTYPRIDGVRLRLLAAGNPQLYEVIP